MNTSFAQRQRPDTGALSHLVEAAAALTQLVEFESPSPPQKAGKRHVLQPATDALHVVSDDADSKPSTVSSSPRTCREIFPQRLMAILQDKSLSDICSWLPHGRSFAIIRPDVFAEQVLPKFFPSDSSRSAGTTTKYPSFTRKLNRWGFRQATRGPDTGAFHHPLFRRDEPHLLFDMVCQKSRKRNSSTTTKSTVTNKSPLPLKKRRLSTYNTNDSIKSAPITTTRLTADALNSLATSSSTDSLAAIVSIASSSQISSSDEQSVCSSYTGASPRPAGFATTSLLPRVATFQATRALSSTPTTWFVAPNNKSNLIQATLKAREEAERRQVYKAMLFASYQQAVKEKER